MNATQHDTSSPLESRLAATSLDSTDAAQPNAADRLPGSAVAALAAEWVAGWCISRGFDPAEPVGQAFWTYPHEDGRDRELLWPNPDRPIDADLLATIGASPTPTWVTVATNDVSAMQGTLVERGVVPAGWPEWLMSVRLDTLPQAQCPDGFDCRLEQRGQVIFAEIRTREHQLACSGQLALSPGGGAVADRIVTEEEFRRRGLGRHLMCRLNQAARDAGATHGLLIASSDGHALYAALGWTTCCDVVVARNSAAMA